MSRIMNIIIVALSIILFVQTASFISYVIEDKKYGYDSDETELLDKIQYQDYASLLCAVCQNEVMDVPRKGDMEAMYAVAHYYENVMMYHAYKTAKDTVKAQERYDKMLEYETQMGDYGFAKEEILDYFGIE